MKDFRTRAFARTHAEFPVLCRLPWQWSHRLVYSRDIGPGGLSFEVPGRGRWLDKLWFVGLPIEVRVESAIVSFTARGHVRRVSMEGEKITIAVVFDELPDKARQALGRYIFFCCHSANLRRAA
jgi:hypothetical protein